MRAKHTVVRSLLVGVLVGCAGSSARGEHSAENVEPSGASLPDSGGSSAASPMQASTVVAADAGTEGAAPVAWDGRVPQEHRASSEQCPQMRAPGSPCTDGGLPPLPAAMACNQDSDCTMGLNGRCLNVPVTLPSGPTVEPITGFYCGTDCSYDECLSDVDCPVGVPCACRFPSIYGSPNTCLIASRCAIDAQCGPPGFCSPSPVVGVADRAYFYFCHTPNDTCIDDSDCVSPPAGPFEPQGLCEFDTASGSWSCRYLPSRL
jgi:hypothetical protein